MSERILDRQGHLDGRIIERSNGDSEVRDRTGHLKGIYDASADVTRDNTGHRVGSGNQLSSLIGND